MPEIRTAFPVILHFFLLECWICTFKNNLKTFNIFLSFSSTWTGVSCSESYKCKISIFFVFLHILPKSLHSIELFIKILIFCSNFIQRDGAVQLRNPNTSACLWICPMHLSTILFFQFNVLPHAIPWMRVPPFNRLACQSLNEADRRIQFVSSITFRWVPYIFMLFLVFPK